jgi:hypothetical protein
MQRSAQDGLAVTPETRCAPADAQRYVLVDILMTEPNESKQKLVVGFASYRPAQWQRVRDISSDADALEDTYEEWLRLERLTWTVNNSSPGATNRAWR